MYARAIQSAPVMGIAHAMMYAHAIRCAPAMGIAAAIVFAPASQLVIIGIRINRTVGSYAFL